MSAPADTPSKDDVTAALVVIGEEILSGRTKDKNIGHIADHCTAVGIRLNEVRIVPDIEDEIIAAVNALRSKFTYVFTTGGIGPTHDDITADSIAKAFGVNIDIHPKVAEDMLSYFARRGVEATPARMRMARIPEGAELVHNTISIAPGFMIGNVIVMAGIPNIMHSMLDYVTPRLRTGRKMLSVSIELLKPEGEIAELFGDCQKAFPDVMMGSYPFSREARVFGTTLVLRCPDAERLAAAEADLRARLTARHLL
jgi:molybdenum cofactor synthesis domain-containing protein